MHGLVKSKVENALANRILNTYDVHYNCEKIDICAKKLEFIKQTNKFRRLCLH